MLASDVPSIMQVMYVAAFKVIANATWCHAVDDILVLQVNEEVEIVPRLLVNSEIVGFVPVSAIFKEDV